MNFNSCLRLCVCARNVLFCMHIFMQFRLNQLITFNHFALLIAIINLNENESKQKSDSGKLFVFQLFLRCKSFYCWPYFKLILRWASSIINFLFVLWFSLSIIATILEWILCDQSRFYGVKHNQEKLFVTFKHEQIILQQFWF